MNNTASIRNFVVFNLGSKYLSDTLDVMIIIDRAAFKHEFIDKVIMILGSQEIKHPEGHKNNHNHGATAKPGRPRVTCDWCDVIAGFHTTKVVKIHQAKANLCQNLAKLPSGCCFVNVNSYFCVVKYAIN